MVAKVPTQIDDVVQRVNGRDVDARLAFAVGTPNVARFVRLRLNNV